MDLNLLWSALRARWRVFAVILAVTMLATLIVSLVVPKSYVAKASLLVDGRDEQSLRANGAPSERDRTGYLQTQVDILTSPKVAQRVVANLKLAQHPVARKSFESSGATGRIDDWLAEQLAKKIKVDTSQSSIVRLSFASTNPDYSALVANGFARAYLDTVLELRVEPNRQASLWFNDEIKSLRDNMIQAEKRLAEFQQQTGIVSVDERYDVDNLALADLASQVARTHEPSAESGGAALPEAFQTLRMELSRAEAHLQELSVELGPRHPQYLRQLAEVQALRGRVKAETDGATVAATRLRDRFETQRQRVLGVKQARNQLAALSREVEVSQRTYDAAMQRFMTSKIESHALQTNVSVLDAAVPPAKPAKPRIGLNLALSLGVGALLGLAAVHLLEMADRRVRVQSDLVGDPRRPPLLGVINDWDPARARLLEAPGARLALPRPG